MTEDCPITKYAVRDSMKEVTDMLTKDNFHVTEAGMRAVLETMTTMNHAICVLSRQAEEAHEALVIMQGRLELLEGTATMLWGSN
jgi:hypothetical protein